MEPTGEPAEAEEMRCVEMQCSELSPVHAIGFRGVKKLDRSCLTARHLILIMTIMLMTMTTMILMIVIRLY